MDPVLEAPKAVETPKELIPPTPKEKRVDAS